MNARVVWSRPAWWLAGCLVLGSVGCAWKADLDKAQAQNADMRVQLDGRAEQISKLTVERDNLESKLAAASKGLADAQGRGARDRRLQGQLSAAKAEVQALTQQKALVEKDRARLDGEVKRLLVEISKKGPVALPPQTQSALKQFAQANKGFEFDVKTGVSKFNADILFDFGKAELKPAAQKMLKGFAAIFNAPVAKNLAIEIVGHTDNRPIRKAGTLQKHPTNWHLSCHRAVGVLQYLQTAGIVPQRMEAAGRGEFDPVVPNDSDANRQKNRRVEIFVVRRLLR